MKLLVTSLLIAACATLTPLAGARAGLSEGRARPTGNATAP